MGSGSVRSPDSKKQNYIDQMTEFTDREHGYLKIWEDI